MRGEINRESEGGVGMGKRAVVLDIDACAVEPKISVILIVGRCSNFDETSMSR